jgi:Actin-like ATPase involved in cell division
MKGFKTLIVGVDDGHDGIKIYCGETGKAFRLPSRVANGRTLMGDSEDVNKQIIHVNGKYFTIDEYAKECIDTRTEDYPLSDANIALVYHALHQAFGGQYHKFKIATGLPLNRYYSGKDRAKNEKLIADKIENLLINKDTSNPNVYNLFDAQQKNEPIQIQKHIVLSEGQCAYFDALMNDNGKRSSIYDDLWEGGCAIIDIGGRTTDIAIVNPRGGTLQASRCDTLDVGIINLKNKVSQNLKDHFGFSTNITDWRITKALRTGIYNHGGKDHDISKILNSAKDEITDQIENSIKVNVQDGQDLGAVLLVGGGSITLGEELLKRFNYDNWRLVNQPEFANARGMYKCAKYITKPKL